MNSSTSHLSLVAIHTENIDQLGVITMWDVRSTPIAQLADSWEDAKFRGPSGLLCRPVPPCAANAMRLACDAIADGRTTIVRRHPVRGVLLIREDLGDDDTVDPSYTPQLHVWLDKGELVFSRPLHPLAQPIRAKFAELRASLTAKEGGCWLGRVVRELHGIPLRSAGGTYFIPAEQAGTWADIVRTIQEATDGAIRVYQVPAYRAQGDTLPLVLAAAQQELEAAVQRMAAECAAGDMSDRVKERRRTQLGNLAEQLAQYEQLCGSTMEALRTQLANVEKYVAVEVITDPNGLLTQLGGL